MTDQHPITPPPELMEQCVQEWLTLRPSLTPYYEWMFAKGARWGWQQRDASVPNKLQVARDEELEACCALADERLQDGTSLRAARRPKPKSQAEQALEALNEAVYMADDVPPEGISTDQAATIRAALERLRELEEGND